MLSGCPKEIPKFEKDIYVGDSATQSLLHKQDEKQILASDPKFDHYICIKDEDFACFVDTYVNHCEKYTNQSACGLTPSAP